VDGYTEFTKRCFLEKQLKPKALCTPVIRNRAIWSIIMTKGERIIAISVCVGVLSVMLVYLNFSSPGKLIIGVDGKINGMQNTLRELLQGKAFWEDQHKQANQSLQYKYDEPANDAKHQAELDQMINEAVRDTDKLMEDIYQDYPSTRPSVVEQQAKALRERADEIERQDERRRYEQYVEERRLERIIELKAIIAIIVVKLNTTYY
jgi:hypothetical protein